MMEVKDAAGEDEIDKKNRSTGRGNVVIRAIIWSPSKFKPTTAQPDLAFVITVLSRSMSNPGEDTGSPSSRPPTSSPTISTINNNLPPPITHIPCFSSDSVPAQLSTSTTLSTTTTTTSPTTPKSNPLSDSTTITLWNPSIGKTFDLPLPSLTFDTHGAFEALLGFGFDSSTHDYKVVRVLRLLERDDIEIEVEVFSL
ncbi:hypothetical protein LINPERHAP1_LOCUS24003 [Linum perenne]